AEDRLAEVKVTVNRNTVPFDERPPTVASGVRIGTPAATMRGFDEGDFREVGRVIVEALAEGPDIDALSARTVELCAKRPLYPGFRGFTTYVACAPPWRPAWSSRSSTRWSNTSSPTCARRTRPRCTSARSRTR